MVDLQPQPFSTESPLVATFSFAEIQSGTGFVNYFAFAGLIPENPFFTYHLTTQNPRSQQIVKNILTGGEQDFDLTPFVISQVAGGQATVTLSYKYTETSGGQTSHLDVDIIRVRDGSELVIGTNRDASIVATQEKNLTLVMDIANTLFEIGDILRLKIRAVEQVGPAGANYDVGIDPQNRDGIDLTPSSEDVTTQLKLIMPFRLQQ